jgi:hypothetical protein
MKLQLVPKPMLSDIWPRVESWISAAIEKGDRWWTMDELFRRVATDPDCELFLVIDRAGIHAAAVALIETAPTGERYAMMPACGGKGAKRWIGLFDGIEAWAAENCATSMKITGRKGWLRLLADYKQTAVLLEKPL